MLEIVAEVWRPKMAPSEKGRSRNLGPSLLAQASTGAIQPLHLQLRLRRQRFRLVTETGIGKKNLVSDYRGTRDGLRTATNVGVKKKLRMLMDKEDKLRLETAMAARTKHLGGTQN